MHISGASYVRPRRRLPASDLLALAQRPPRPNGLLGEATRRPGRLVSAEGRLSSERLESHQHAAHGLAWLSTYAEAVRELGSYAERLTAEGRFGEAEELLVRIGLGEYLDQIFGGIPMSQGEIVRLSALSLSARDAAAASVRRWRC